MTTDYHLAQVLAMRGESPGTPLWENVVMVARRTVVCMNISFRRSCFYSAHLGIASNYRNTEHSTMGTNQALPALHIDPLSHFFCHVNPHTLTIQYP